MDHDRHKPAMLYFSSRLGWIESPQNSHPHGTSQRDLIWKRELAYRIKLRWGHIGLGWAQNRINWCLIGRPWEDKDRLEWCSHQSRASRKLQKMENKARALPGPQSRMALSTLGFQSSSLPQLERIHFCGFIPPSGMFFIMAGVRKMDEYFPHTVEAECIKPGENQEALRLGDAVAWTLQQEALGHTLDPHLDGDMCSWNFRQSSLTLPSASWVPSRTSVDPKNTEDAAWPRVCTGGGLSLLYPHLLDSSWHKLWVPVKPDHRKEYITTRNSYIKSHLWRNPSNKEKDTNSFIIIYRVLGDVLNTGHLACCLTPTISLLGRNVSPIYRWENLRSN